MKKFIENFLTDFPENKLNELDKIYSSVAGQHIRFIHNTVLVEHVRKLYSECNAEKKSMLDLGSMYDFILPQVGDNSDYRLATDFVSEHEFEEQTAKHNFPFNSEYVSGDIEHFQNERQFDIVICSEVAEHVLNPSKCFSKIADCLSENGRAIISFPNVLFWRERLRFLMTGGFNNYAYETIQYGHTNIYTKENFRTLIELSGMQIEKRLPSFRYPYPKFNIVKLNDKYSDWYDYGVIYVCKLR